MLINEIVDVQAHGFSCVLFTNLQVASWCYYATYLLRLRIIYSSIRLVVVSISLYVIFGVRHEKNIQNIF